MSLSSLSLSQVFLSTPLHGSITFYKESPTYSRKISLKYRQYLKISRLDQETERFRQIFRSWGPGATEIVLRLQVQSTGWPEYYQLSRDNEARDQPHSTDYRLRTIIEIVRKTIKMPRLAQTGNLRLNFLSHLFIVSKLDASFSSNFLAAFVLSPLSLARFLKGIRF